MFKRLWVGNSVLTAGSLLFGIVICEIGLRLVNLLILPGGYWIDDRKSFWSSAYLRLDSSGAIRAVTNATVREVMYINKHIEYDVTFKTNNLGLIDDRDYSPVSDARRRVVFVGDSFTAGTGAPPWVPKLAKELVNQGTGIELFNLGFAGTGIHHFARLVESFREEIPFDELYVLVICNDFGRADWVPRSTADGFYFCSDSDTCLSQPPLIQFIGLEDTEADIVQRAKFDSVNNARHVQVSAREISWIKKVIAASALLSGMNMLRQEILMRKRETVEFQKLIEADLPSLNRLAAFSGPKYFVHIPQKQEIERGHYICSPKTIVESRGFKYVPLLNHCQINTSHYHKADLHLNADGTQVLQRCMKEYVINAEKSP